MVIDGQNGDVSALSCERLVWIPVASVLAVLWRFRSSRLDRMLSVVDSTQRNRKRIYAKHIMCLLWMRHLTPVAGESCKWMTENCMHAIFVQLQDNKFLRATIKSGNKIFIFSTIFWNCLVLQKRSTQIRSRITHWAKRKSFGFFWGNYLIEIKWWWPSHRCATNKMKYVFILSKPDGASVPHSVIIFIRRIWFTNTKNENEILIRLVSMAFGWQFFLSLVDQFAYTSECCWLVLGKVQRSHSHTQCRLANGIRIQLYFFNLNAN